MNILLVSENCSRQMGGESILAYHYFRLLKQRGHAVRLLVHERNRAELASVFPQYMQDIYFIEDTEFQKTMWRLGTKIPRRIAEVTLFFLVSVSSGKRLRKLARLIVGNYDVEVVHQVMPVSPRAPSHIFDVGAPVVIGPMNGAMEYPPAFRKEARIGGRLAYALGKALSSLMNALIPGKRRAAVLLAANQRTANCLRMTLGEKRSIRFLVENGVNLDLWKSEIELPEYDTPTFAYVGSLVDLKGVKYLLLAMSGLVKSVQANLLVIGDGPERDALEALASDCRIGARVKFLGFRRQDEIPGLLGRCRALVLPSLHDCGGAVILEAMAMRKPVIATDWGGPADYIDDSCGILVKPDSEELFVEGLTKAMAALADDPILARGYGLKGREKIEKQYDWSKKIEEMERIYAASMN